VTVGYQFQPLVVVLEVDLDSRYPPDIEGVLLPLLSFDFVTDKLDVNVLLMKSGLYRLRLGCCGSLGSGLIELTADRAARWVHNAHRSF
jgi:hypothetical protein